MAMPAPKVSPTPHTHDIATKRPLNDARGIFCANICDQCEGRVRGHYRADIFHDTSYWHDEPIEEDDCQ